MTCRTEASGAPGKPTCHRLFTFEQAAAFGGVPIQQICQWMMAHKLEAYRVCGGCRIDELELAALLSVLRSRRR